MRGTSLTQPLVSRPAYGEGQVAQSGLPGGGPSDKGLSLDSDIPGEATFNKPVDDVREFDKAEEGSIYRKDGPDDLAKPQKDQQGDERHHEQFKPTFAPPGGRPKDDAALTRYPYRDGIPNAHNAAQFVVGLWLLQTAPVLRLASGGHFKVAATSEQILNGLNPKFEARARTCSANLKRADLRNLRWIFSVDCGNGPKVVTMKAFRPKGNVAKLAKMDVDLSCSCPAWRWLGPEHHAQREEYLDRDPRGTASVPVIRDPRGINRVCKHVAAALSLTKDWNVPVRKEKG